MLNKLNSMKHWPCWIHDLKKTCLIKYGLARTCQLPCTTNRSSQVKYHKLLLGITLHMMQKYPILKGE